MKKKHTFFYPLALAAALLASCDKPHHSAADQKTTPPAPKLATAGIFSGFGNAGPDALGGGANLVIKSADGGQTWDDISLGLTETIALTDFVGQEDRFYLRTENGLYHSKVNLGNLYWEKENLAADRASIAPGRRGLYAFTEAGQFYYRSAGAGEWMPVYKDMALKQVRTIFEIQNAVFVGTERGLFKSANGGKTWKHVHQGGWVMKVVASGGVLLATCDEGILRSTDNGETWLPVIRESGVGIAVEVIRDGFAAITYNGTTQTRRVRTSYDGGNTWMPIDTGMPASPLISSIVQAGSTFFCGHPDGIFRSTDNGKTWKLILPSIDGKVFNLTVYGNTVFALRKAGGC